MGGEEKRGDGRRGEEERRGEEKEGEERRREEERVSSAPLFGDVFFLFKKVFGLRRIVCRLHHYLYPGPCNQVTHTIRHHGNRVESRPITRQSS